MDIAKRITELRTDKGLSVNKLANLAGLSQGFIREVELGEKNLTVKSLSFICDALDITLEGFFSTNKKTVVASKVQDSLNRLTSEQQDALLKFIELL